MKIRFIENRTTGFMRHTRQCYEDAAKVKKSLLASDEQQHLAYKHIRVREPISVHTLLISLMQVLVNICLMNETI